MYDTILVPTDGSPGAQSAVEKAFDLAETYDATVHALNVVELVYTYDFDPGRLLDQLRAAGERATEDVATAGRERGIDIVTAVERGSPHEVIVEYAADHDVDLIVIGTHGRRGVRRALLGSVTERVIRLADVSVLVTRRKEDTGEGDDETAATDA
ncbi:universal stress protein [Halomarina ordinaria]|uniref:Universal stress protein n=1 Tax=Halomarina ordinaria TaxID=3033939 RepID=A0ABD5U3W6_9EURY|nr:universal stress protein [Halomarina sp. PSRA2]